MVTPLNIIVLIRINRHLRIISNMQERNENLKKENTDNDAGRGKKRGGGSNDDNNIIKLSAPRELRRYFMKQWTVDYTKVMFRRQNGDLGN